MTIGIEGNGIPQRILVNTFSRGITPQLLLPAKRALTLTRFIAPLEFSHAADALWHNSCIHLKWKMENECVTDKVDFLRREHLLPAWTCKLMTLSTIEGPEFLIAESVE